MLTVNNELEGTWKEAVVAKFEVLLWHMAKGPVENQTKVTNVPAGTRTVVYPKKSELHRFIEPSDIVLRYYTSIFMPSKRKS